MNKNFTASISAKDNGYNRFNAYSGHECFISTNDMQEFLDGIRAFATSVPWEPDDSGIAEEIDELLRGKE